MSILIEWGSLVDVVQQRIDELERTRKDIGLTVKAAALDIRIDEAKTIQGLMDRWQTKQMMRANEAMGEIRGQAHTDNSG